MAKGKKKGNGRKSGVPSSQVVVYRGPARLTKVPQDEMITVTLSNIFGQTGGTLGMQFNGYISVVTGCPDWSGFVSNWNECRIIAVALKYLPARPHGDSSVVHSEGIGSVVSNGVDPGPFTALSQMTQYDYKELHTGEKFELKWGMSSVEEGQWGATSLTPANHCYLYAFFPRASSTGANVYGSSVIDWLVQFRGRS